MNKVKKIRQEKGITLQALLITIIVLIILAVVTIRAVKENGITSSAENAAISYQTAQSKEKDLLKYYESYLKEEVGQWKQEGDIIKRANSDGTIVELKIGDKIEYNELSNGVKTHKIDYTENGGTSSSKSQSLTTQDLEWRVLGLNDKGQLELISTQPTASTIYLRGENGYLNSKTILNTTCNELYGNGEGAESARSLNVDDVNKLAGIKTEADKQALSSKYGVWWRYKYDTTTGCIKYSNSKNYNPETKEGTWTNYANTSDAKFKEPGKIQIDSTNTEDIAELKYTYYSYTISSKITQTTSDGILVSDLIIKGLNADNNAANSSYKKQWLASPCVLAIAGYAEYRIWCLSSSDLKHETLLNSREGLNAQNLPLRPVVILKSDVQISDTDGNGVLNTSNSN